MWCSAGAAISCNKREVRLEEKCAKANRLGAGFMARLGLHRRHETGFGE